MAAISTSNIQRLEYNFGRLSIDGFPIEMYRVTPTGSEGAVGDTVTITPNRFKIVKAAWGGPTVHNLPSPVPVGTNPITQATNVTFTLRASTPTNVAFDVVLVGEQRN